MARTAVRSSWIVRVVEAREGLRILLHDLKSRQIHEFASWEAATAFMRSLSERRGLR